MLSILSSILSVPTSYQATDLHLCFNRFSFNGLTSLGANWRKATPVPTRATIRGTHRGTLFGVAPTNKGLTWSVLLIDQIADGKIVLHYANADWVGVLTKLGVVTAPGEIPRPAVSR